MNNNSIKYQRILLVVSLLLFLVKISAWLLTGSVAILTDALESTVNVVAGFLGLYSLILSAKPKDKEHPYGHGKVEFITSAMEGTLIGIAGLIILYEAFTNLYHPHELKKLDYGLILIAITALVNYWVGYYCVKQGEKENSPVLIASGAHLKTDTYSTIGLIIGLIIVLITGIKELDSIVAMIFSLVIMFTGYKIVRKSISGIMDESDEAIIKEIVDLLNTNRRAEWIDVHNLRVINYAGFYHIDCHLTVPFYLNLHEAHRVLDRLTEMFQEHFKNRVEFFIHLDGCLFSQCRLCKVDDCTYRKNDFEQHVPWTMDNILSNEKHQL